MYVSAMIGIVYAHSENDYMGHHMFSTDWWGDMLWMIVFWILAITVVLSIAFYLVKNFDTKKSSLDVLEKRYVKGKIDKEEFEEKKKILK